MEAIARKPYQGVLNIIRFNWHFYVIAFASVIALLTAAPFMSNLMFWVCVSFAIGIITSTCISLLVSHYVYDRSNLYDFEWLPELRWKGESIVNIHAGFDETSAILKKTFPDSRLMVFDFYDPVKHTEISIERARKAYPPFDGTNKITTGNLPVASNSAGLIMNIFALHEVRDHKERITFLRQQVAALGNDGRVVVVEHLRDMPNLLAYNIGFFHFLSESEWNNNFQKAGLALEKKFKVTPFISVFILQKVDGSTH